MALKALISAEEYGKLSDAIKAEYKAGGSGTPHEGKYVVDVVGVGGFALEDVSGLKSALGSERSLREKAEAAVKSFEGLDAKVVREALAQIEELKQNPVEGRVKAQLEAREKALKEKFDKDLSEKENMAKDLQRQLENHLVNSTATAAIASQKGNVRLLLPHVLSQIKVERDQKSGNFVAKVVDKDGNPRISLKSGSTENMSIDELVESMRSDDTYMAGFEGTRASGTGAQGSGSGRGGSKRVISKNDAEAISANIEAIAKGEVIVTEN